MLHLESARESFCVPQLEALRYPNYNTVSGSQARLADATGVIRPGQPYTAAAAGGNYGALRQTVSNTVGFGTNRQFQLALRLNF